MKRLWMIVPLFALTLRFGSIQTSSLPLPNGGIARSTQTRMVPSPTVTGTRLVVVTPSTPLEDGSIYHVVQANEALWSIALAYNITVDDLKKINRLASNDIFVGQKLAIKIPVVETPTLEPTTTATLGIPTSTATHPVTPTRTSTVTPIPTPPASRASGQAAVGVIVATALLAAGVGAWLGRKKSD